MRLPLAWLAEYVDLPGDAQAIADRLAMLGFPVEEIVRRPAITGVVVGKIVELEKHPNADRLQVARIDVGGDRPLTIATAATNVAAGQTIAVATIGAKLPELTIQPRTMRGVASEGMMISAEELALPGEWFEDGIMQLESEYEPGTDVVELFGLSAEVLDVEITSNRVDAMSVLGLARELAASYGVPLREPSFENPGTQSEPPREEVRVEIESPDCNRFVAQRFDGIRNGVAPAWMRVRLALAGQRPIGSLVDVSNYVMFETGQPLHFYDAASIAGGELIVRDGRPEEKTVTLDGAERTLSPQSLVIADRERTLCLAGLMGAQAGEVSESTTAIVLEAANFNGARVRRMSQAFALRSEASSRHEKTLAPALTDAGAARAAQLLVQLGANAYVPRAFGQPLVAAKPIELRVSDVERILGLSIPATRIASHLEALGCAVAPETGRDAAAELSVTPPAWRRDIALAADLIEEVARVEGYENVPSIVPSVPAHDISSAQYDLENRIAETLVALGYREITTYSLHGQQFFDRAKRAGLAAAHHPVEVLNPLSEDQRFLRDSLAPGTIEYFAKIDAPVRVFEIGHVFTRDDGHINESVVVSFGFAAEPVDEPAWRDTNFLRLKGDAESFLHAIAGRRAEAAADERDGLHPGKTAILMIDGKEVASAGKVDPRLARAFDLRLPCYICTAHLDALPDYAVPRYQPPSRFPSTYRDLALVVSLDVAASAIERAIAQTLGAACTGVRAFDEYRGPQVGEGRKSMAVRFTLTRFDATITDAEADEAVERVLEALHREFGATIRA